MYLLILAVLFAVAALWTAWLSSYIEKQSNVFHGVLPLPVLNQDSSKDHSTEHRILNFQASRPISVGTPSRWLQEANRILTWKFPNFTKRVDLWHIQSVLTMQEVFDILRLLPKDFNEDPDTLDQLPTYEHYFMQGGQWVKGLPLKLMDLLQSAIQDKLLPYVRLRFDCPHCSACTALVRRYYPGERLRVPPHFDSSAFVTAVIALTSDAHFRGGLFVRTAPGTEEFVHMEMGDAVLHQHDLEHGVVVEDGVRYSLIFWLQDSLACRIGAQPHWHEEKASHGDPISSFLLGQLHGDGKQCPVARIWYALLVPILMPWHSQAPACKPVVENWTRAAPFFQYAAEQNYARAQHMVGLLFLFGDGVKKDKAAALQWLLKSAAQNYSDALYAAGKLLLEGSDEESKVVEAVTMLERSTTNRFHQNPDALNTLANVLAEGAKGVAQDSKRALFLWQLAAGQGVAAAAMNLGRTHLHGELGVEQNSTVALRWLSSAAHLGDPGAEKLMLSLID